MVVVFVLLFGWLALNSAAAESSFLIPRSNWAVIGPFDYQRYGGFEPVYPPEYRKVQLDASYRGREGRRVAWQRLVWTGDKGAGLNFDRLWGGGDGIAYAFTTLHSTTKREVFFELERAGQAKIWVNGAEVSAQEYDSNSSRGVGELLAGWNHILVKSYSGQTGWRVLLRIKAMRADSLADISCKLPDETPSARKAALLSTLLTGTGHFYLDEFKEGMFLLGGNAALLAASFLFSSDDFKDLVNPSDDTDIRDFLSNPPLVAATELSLFSAYLAYRKAREKGHNIGYRQPPPDESLQELARAPLDLDIITKRDFFVPLIVEFGAVMLLKRAMFSRNDAVPAVNQAKNSVRVYGIDLPASMGYQLGLAGLWSSFTAVSLGEEAFFRGFLQSELEEVLGKRAGWVTASALFGAAHIPNGDTAKERVLASLSAFMGGLVMGYFFQRDDYSLKRPIAYHTWWNFSLGTIDLLQNPQDSMISGNIVFRF